MVQFECFTCGSLPLLLSKVTEFGKQQESVLIVNLQSSLSDVFCPSRLCPLPSSPYFLSHSFTFPPVSYTPTKLSPPCLESPCTCLSSLSPSLCYPCLLLGARAPLCCHYTLICSLCFLAVGVILQSSVEAIIN